MGVVVGVSSLLDLPKESRDAGLLIFTILHREGHNQQLIQSRHPGSSLDVA